MSSPLYTYDATFIGTEISRLAGCDEAGRGPLAGPVVAAAVIINHTTPIEKLNDSKKLSAAQRDTLYTEITETAECWSVGIATAQEIDETNILHASLCAMKRALDTIPQWDLVLVDGNQYIRDIAQERQKTVVGGDAKSASIAAASIIAKVHRDRMMQAYHEKYPHYGFDKHKGYPTQAHRDAVAHYGHSPIHRKSFGRRDSVQLCLDIFSKDSHHGGPGET